MARLTGQLYDLCQGHVIKFKVMPAHVMTVLVYSCVILCV